MIASAVITVICFIVIIIDLISMANVLRSCKNVRCSVVSSKKISERESSYLIREYYQTEISFKLENTERTAVIETSTFCQQGQVLNCYYYPKKNLVFRKRDIRGVFSSYTVPALSIGLLFLVLNTVFHVTSLGGIILEHTTEAFGIVLGTVFSSFGVGFIVYSINAFRHTRHSRVMQVSAEIIDIVRKTKKHGENIQHSYFPVYYYKLNATEHTVLSKFARQSPPKKHSKETILIDTKKGGPVEYKDIGSSFVLGILFIIIAALLVYTIMM